MNKVGNEHKMTMSISDAASALGIGRHTAYTLAGEGKLPGAFRLGGRILISRKALERFVDGDHHDGK